MSQRENISHCFVTHIPKELDDGVLYVSMEYSTAAHACLCGCGKEVVTPLSPTDWQLEFDGVSVSLWPSVGNWSFPCESHYFIVADKVRWSPKLSRRQIEAGRRRSRQLKARQIDTGDGLDDSDAPTQLSDDLSWRFWRRRS